MSAEVTNQSTIGSYIDWGVGKLGDGYEYAKILIKDSYRAVSNWTFNTAIPAVKNASNYAVERLKTASNYALERLTTAFQSARTWVNNNPEKAKYGLIGGVVAVAIALIAARFVGKKEGEQV